MITSKLCNRTPTGLLCMTPRGGIPSRNTLRTSTVTPGSEFSPSAWTVVGYQRSLGQFPSTTTWPYAYVNYTFEVSALVSSQLGIRNDGTPQGDSMLSLSRIFASLIPESR